MTKKLSECQAETVQFMPIEKVSDIIFTMFTTFLTQNSELKQIKHLFNEDLSLLYSIIL